jgi:uncharacterized membrane protein
MDYGLKPFTVGEAIGKGFTIVMESLPFFLLVGLCFALPVTLSSAFLGSSPTTSDGSLDWLRFVLSMLLILGVSVLVSALSTAFFVLRIASKFLEPSNKVFRAGAFARVLPTAVAACLLTSLAVVGGLFLLVVPGILLALSYNFTQSCVVLEGLGAREAMRRSRALAKGKKGQIFLLALFQLLLSLLLGLVTRLAVNPFHLGTSLTSAISSTLAQSLVIPLSSAIDVVYFLGVKVEKEAFDVERLAAGFGEEALPGGASGE